MKDLSRGTNSDDSGIDVSYDRRVAACADEQDQSCVLSRSFLESLGLGTKLSSLPVLVADAIEAGREAKNILDDALTPTDVFSRSARRDTPVPSMYGLPNITADSDVEADSDDWDKDTTRSTAFFSARSSLLSAESSDDDTEEDVTSRNVFANRSLDFPKTPTLEYAGGRSYF